MFIKIVTRVTVSILNNLLIKDKLKTRISYEMQKMIGIRKISAQLSFTVIPL